MQYEKNILLLLAALFRGHHCHISTDIIYSLSLPPFLYYYTNHHYVLLHYSHKYFLGFVFISILPFGAVSTSLQIS